MKKGRSIWERLAVMVLLYLAAMSAVILITWILVEKCMGMKLQTADDFIKEDKLGTLSVSSDGFYEIKSREDYMIFWEAVEDGNFNINGRLLNDIRLNETGDMENWGYVMPEYICGRAKHYSGIFDGGGYTIYGLYAKDGYGIVCNNNGTIQNLKIKDSVVRGGVRGAGICLYNSSSNALVSNCSFYGEISSTYSSIPAAISGICAFNEGVIDKCGFMGRINLKNSTANSCNAAGICMTNLGKISNCYNLTKSSFKGKGKKYAITDQGEKNCYMLANTGWLAYGRQTLALTVEQSFLIDAYINKDINALIKNNQPKWLTQFSAMQDGLSKEKDNEIPFEKEHDEGDFKAGGNLGIKEESVREARLYGILQDEVVRNIVINILFQKSGSIENFSFDTEEREDGFCLNIAYGKENILLSKFSVNGASEENKLWEKCGQALSQENEDTWSHETYVLLPEYVFLPEETFDEKLLFYHTQKEENGIFYVNGENLYQMAPGDADGEEELAAAGEYLLTVYDTYRGKENRGAVSKKDGRKKVSVFQTAFKGLLDGRIPSDGIGWKDEKIRESVCEGISGKRDTLLSREEILSFKNLEVPDGESINTLMDLEKLPGLTCLYVEGCENEKAIKDLKKLHLNNLTELYLMSCGIEDISFVENMPALTEISFYDNQIWDISPLSGCKKLTIVSLGMNHISDITALEELPVLEEAGLQWNQIENIEILGKLKNLTAVNLSANQVTDLSPLEGKTNFTALGLAGNNISDITPLRNMTDLMNLSLSSNQIRDISALENMTEMEWLGLSGNRIEDFSPIVEMKNLFFLDVSDNPCQNIGELCLVPNLTVGARASREAEMEELEWAQGLLSQYESRLGMAAEDLAWGDLNGDGIRDAVITGCMGEEIDEEGRIINWDQRERKVYAFLGLGEGKYILLRDVQTLSPSDGGIWGDPYLGTAICDNKLVVQCYGGSNYRWCRTDIYEYLDGKLEESCSLSLNNSVWARGYDWYVRDLKNDGQKRYAFAGEWERHMEKLLLQDNAYSEKGSSIKEEYLSCIEALNQGKEEKLPEITGWYYMPETGEGSYGYEIHEPLYETKKDADFVLWYTAQTYMKDIAKLPIPEYSSGEIKHNYNLLAGVELPDSFYIGEGYINSFSGKQQLMLSYEGCFEDEDGGYVHKMKVYEAVMGVGVTEEENSFWSYAEHIYYYENTGRFEIC